MLHAIIALGALLFPAASDSRLEVEPPQEVAFESTVRVYDIGELTGQNELAALQATLSDPSTEQVALRVALKEYAQVQKKLRELDTGETIMANIERFMPPTPGPEFEAVLLSRSQMAVAATTREHAWIEGYLRAASRTNVLVDISVTMYDLERGSLKALGIAESPNGVVVPSAEVVKAKISALESAKVVSAPLLTVNPGAKASLSVWNQTAYVKDCEVKMIGDPPREVIDPVVEKFTTGLTLLTRALPISDTHTAMHADVKWSQLRHLSEVTKTFGESKTPVTIQLPELVELNAVARFDISFGAAIVVTGIDPGREGSGAGPREFVTVITATQLEAVAEDIDEKGLDEKGLDEKGDD
jgi:hypothetical protein